MFYLSPLKTFLICMLRHGSHRVRQYRCQQEWYHPPLAAEGVCQIGEASLKMTSCQIVDSAGIGCIVRVMSDRRIV